MNLSGHTSSFKIQVQKFRILEILNFHPCTIEFDVLNGIKISVFEDMLCKKGDHTGVMSIGPSICPSSHFQGGVSHNRRDNSILEGIKKKCI